MPVTEPVNPDSGAERPVIVMIGASGGIGTALIERLLLTMSASTQLVLAARDEARLRAVAEGHSQCVVRPVDARDFAAMDALMREASEMGSHLAGVVNLAGSILLKPAHLTTGDEWMDVISTNLTTAFATVRSVGAAVTRKARGKDPDTIPRTSIVLLSSAAARTGLANHEAIAAAKAGVIGLVRSAAATYVRAGIRVNAIAPGLVDTPLAAPITKNERSREASRSMHPLGRLGRPDDIASLIAWLLDDRNDWVTGEVFGVDGGLASLRVRSTTGSG